MSTDQPWTDTAASEQLFFRRPRIPKPVRYMLFSVLASLVATAGPLLLAILGIGMSEQDGGVASNGAFASWLAICAGFLIIRRLIRVPLLRAYSYVAMTFLACFLIIAIVPGTKALIQFPKRTLGPLRFMLLSAAPSGKFHYQGVVADLNADLEPA